MDRSRLNRLPVLFLATVLACVSVLTPQSSGQIVDIPDAIITNTGSQSPDAVQTIKAYVEANSKNLMSENPILLGRDRNAILRKLEGPNISVSFRLAYDQELQQHIQAMLGSKSPLTVINGLVIAGNVATDRTLAQIVEKLGSPAADIRFDAAVALGRVFTALQQHQAAVNQPGNTVRMLEGLLAKEKDPLVRDALIRAGTTAAGIPSERATAVSVISRGVSAAIRAMKPETTTPADIDSLLRAGVNVRDIATRAVQQNSGMSPAAAKDAADMAGMLLVHVSKMVKHQAGKGDTSVSRDALVQLAASAQTTIELSAQLLGTQVQPPKALLTDLRAGTKEGDAAFAEDVRAVVGQGGLLTKAPFSLAADQFK